MCHWRLSSLFITPTVTTVSPPRNCVSSALNNVQHDHFKPFSISVMLRDRAKLGGSTKQGKVKGVALVDSPARVAPLTTVKDPPPYGAQYRQDALWEGE